MADCSRRRSERFTSFCRSLFRRKPRHAIDEHKDRSIQKTRAELGPGITPIDDEQSTNVNARASLKGDGTSLPVLTERGSDAAPNLGSQEVINATGVPKNYGTASDSEDLWSAAFREAVEEVKKHVDVSIFEGQNVAKLFKNLEDINEAATQEDVFLRGVKYLRSIQVPLENFKLALDLASPLTALEPTTMTVFGVVRSVTAIAISLATADLDFAKQVGEMLDHMKYIDDCDTLGRKTNQSDIHKALVSVYGKILEFYSVALDVLTRRGLKLFLTMIWEKEHLPEIVQDFLKHANNLGRLVNKATLQITTDIKEILTQLEIYQWLGKDKIDNQAERHAQLHELRRPESDAQNSMTTKTVSLSDQACEFLLTDAKFVAWFGSSNIQHLVILGEMGCGKSVLFAFLIDELRRRNEHQLPKPKMCYYYCRDDWTGKITDILSVLILQLLDQFPGMKLTFYEWYKQMLESGMNPAKDESMLEDFLRTVIVPLDRQLYIMIDGLDECGRPARRKLVNLFKSLAAANSRLKIVFSSRPDGETLEQLNFMEMIKLSANSRRDRLISQHIVDRQLPYLAPGIREVISGFLSKTAHGSAIWTRMMVDLIEVEDHNTLPQIERCLENMALPTQLSDVYDRMLSQCSSEKSELRRLAVSALRILAAVRRPISISELAFAVALDTAPQDVTTVAALETMADGKRVIWCIRPFIAQIDYEDSKRRQIRLVHQSVKEYVVERLNPYQDPCPNHARKYTNIKLLVGQVAQHLEECILNICMRYLMLEEMDTNVLFSEQDCAIDALPQSTDLFDDTIAGAEQYTKDCTWEEWEANMIRYDPAERGFGGFFVYASCHWVDHLGSIGAEYLPDLLSIERICSRGSTRLCNWIEQNRRPDCVLQARFEFEPGLYDPLSIASLYGSDAVLLDILKRSDFDSERYHTQSGIRAVDQILQWCGPERLATFMNGMRARVCGTEFATVGETSTWKVPHTNQKLKSSAEILAEVQSLWKHVKSDLD